MTLYPITIGGKSGTVVYLDRDWHPVEPEHAAIAKVIFDNGATAFFTTGEREDVEKFDPHQLRDEKGRWATGGKAGALVTDTGNTYLHGTAQGFLEDILRNGIRGSEGGKIHPKDKRNRTLALPGHVYMTTDLAEAKEYAQSTGLSDEFFLKHKETVLNPEYAKGYPRVPEYEPSYDAGTEIGGGLPCVITIELPPSVVKKLRKDRRSDILTPEPYAPGGYMMGGKKQIFSDFARSYKGDIKPEWIKSITYMTKDLATGTETWHTIDAKDYKKPGPQTPPYLPQPPGWEVSPEWQEYLKDTEKKVAADGTVIYLALKIPLHSIAGLGGITRKFDEAKHPRGTDGRFKEATEPRIFNRLSDVEQYESWGREKRWQWRKETPKSGFLLTGEPIPREQLPPVLYHVTTNAPAVESSGVLLGLQEGGGLGGGQAEGVSFTSSKEDADVILRELKRSVLIARGEVDIDVFERWAREDEQTAGLPEGTLNHAVEFSRSSWDVDAPNMGKTHYWDKDAPEGERYKEGPPAAPEEKERVRRSLLKDALNAYLIARDTVSREQNAPSIKNPILFGRQEHLAKLDPEGIQILEVESAQIPLEALVTTGSDTFLHEVRAYSDVPYRRRKKVAYDPNQPRGKEGTPEGGQFVETGRSGVPTPDPVLAVQAKAGIAAVERLLPEAVRTADFDPGSAGVTWETVDQPTQDSVYHAYIKAESDNMLAGNEDMDYLDAEAWADKNWHTLSDQDKSNVMNDYAIMGKLPARRQLEKKEPENWVTGVETGTHSEQNYARTHEVALRLAELRTDELRKERGLMKSGAPVEYTVVQQPPNPEFEGGPSEDSFEVRDATGRVVGFASSKAGAHAFGTSWARQQSTDIPSDQLIHQVWEAWKQKSSERLGLSLQLAAARELGGVHRMTPDEVQEAEDSAVQELGNNGMATLQAYVRAQWEVTQFVMQKAGEDKVAVYRGLMLPGDQVRATTHVVTDKLGGLPKDPPTNIKRVEQRVAPELDTPEKPPLKVFVAFDYDGEHFVEEKLRTVPKSIVDIPPGGSPYESDDVTIQRRLDRYHQNQSRRGLLFTKLPDLQLQRAGAQSTTGSRSVANDWGGVGNLPPDPKRVVVRVEAPATSVLSLPVYGENAQAEHESVILGTRDKWLWDAWYDIAPSFESQSISGTPVPKKTLAVEWPKPVDYDTAMALKVEKKPLIIDLQAEDRDKPHWMSSVDWSKVQSVAEKFDEAKHPRDTKGQFAPFYHGTSNEIAEKILAEGLKPLSEMDRTSPIGKGFASTSEKVALSYAAMASDDSTDTITVIVFKPEASQFLKPAGKLVPGGRPGTWGHARSTEMSSTETVPPEMIEEVRQYRLADVLEAIGPRDGKQYADWETPLEDLDPVRVVRKEDRIYLAFPTKSEAVVKWDELKHPRDEEGQFTRVAMTSQRPESDPGHQPNKDVFRHMREFHEQLEALPGVSSVSVKPGVGGWEGGSESMWQIYYKGNGEARKLVARTAKQFDQDAVLILNACKKGQDCQPAVELSFDDAISPGAREDVHKLLVAHGISGWTWQKRNGKTLLRMVSVPQWGSEAKQHQQATVAISEHLRKNGLKNHRKVHKVAVSVMEREGTNSYDAVIKS